MTLMRKTFLGFVPGLTGFLCVAFLVLAICPVAGASVPQGSVAASVMAGPAGVGACLVTCLHGLSDVLDTLYAVASEVLTTVYQVLYAMLATLASVLGQM